MTSTGVLGLIRRDGDEWRLAIYDSARKRKLAIVVGSSGYVLRALVAVGLATPVPALTKNWNRARVALICGKPANGDP